jgi:hypothetical protein
MKLRRWLARFGDGGAPSRSRGRAGGRPSKSGEDEGGRANTEVGVGVGRPGAFATVVVVGETWADEGAVPY